MLFSESLKKNRDFQKVYRKGRSLANKYLVMYILENGTDRNHLGISVSKKVGNSVVRHHLTRLVRESYRRNEERIPYPEILSIKFYKSSLYRLALKVRQILRTGKRQDFSRSVQ